MPALVLGAIAGLALVHLSAVSVGAFQAATPPPAAEAIRRAFFSGDYGGAVTLAETRLKERPDDVPVEILHARAQAALGRFEAAFAGFERARRRDPRNPDILYYMSLTAGVLAQGEYERLFTLAPDSARAHQLRGESLQAQDKAEEAEPEFRKALEKNPRSLELLITLGDLNRKRLRFAEAQSYYARAAEMAPGNYDVLYGLGVCHSFRGEQGKAASLFREALRREPGSASARLALGTALLQTGQPAEAATELEAATATEPGMRQAHYQLGRAYQALGRTKEAEAAFARAQELLQQQRATETDVLQPDPR